MTAKTKPRTIADRIKHLGPCSDARKWAEGYTSPAKAWRECQRGDWMLWLVGNKAGPPESDDRKRLALCACKCARLSLPLYEKRHPGDNRVRKCIETAERWAEGKATIEEVRQARAAAESAASAAWSAEFAQFAASSDAWSAWSAASAAWSAEFVEFASWSAAWSANSASWSDADTRTSVLSQCSDIVREFYPRPPKIRSEA